MILEVFSNLNDSTILNPPGPRFTSVIPQFPVIHVKALFSCSCLLSFMRLELHERLQDVTNPRNLKAVSLTSSSLMLSSRPSGLGRFPAQKKKGRNKGFDQSTSGTLSRWVKKVGWKILKQKTLRLFWQIKAQASEKRGLVTPLIFFP